MAKDKDPQQDSGSESRSPKSPAAQGEEAAQRGKKSDSSGGEMLGAGGTSPASPEHRHQSGRGSSQSGSGKGKKNKGSEEDSGKTGAGTKATGAGLGAAVGMGAAMAFRLGRSALVSSTRLIMNAIQQMIKFIAKGIMKMLVKPLMAAGGAVSGMAGAVGIGISAGTGAAVVGTTALVGGGALAGGAANSSAPVLDDPVDVCEMQARDLVDQHSSGGGEIDDAQAEANAEVIYSVLSAWGMPDENIAGVVGNWDAESSIDPTSVETIMDEPHEIGEQKQAAEDADFMIDQIDAEYAAQFPTIVRAGIGLGQWTDVGEGGGRNTLLREYAAENDQDWHSLEIQLGFMFIGDEPSRVDTAERMIDESMGTPGEAASWFMTNWEGLEDGSTGARIDSAETYMGKFGGWDADEGLADSIMDQVAGSSDRASQAAVDAAYDECDEQNDRDRADLSHIECAEPGTGVEDYGYGSDIEDVLHANAVDGFLCGYGTWGPDAGEQLQQWHSYRPGDSGSDHSVGAALDLSTTHLMYDAEGQEYARDVAEWYMTHAEELNVSRIIYWEQTWDPSMGEVPFEDWDTYPQAWCGDGSWSYVGHDFPVSESDIDAGGDHSCSHRNHPHISFQHSGSNE